MGFGILLAGWVDLILFRGLCACCWDRVGKLGLMKQLHALGLRMLDSMVLVMISQ